MPNETLLFPPFQLDPANAQLWRADEEISLRPKTFEVLRYLVDHPGQLVTKAALLDAVWPSVTVSDTMPASCVAELRRALNDDAKAPKFIETVHRRGYRFLAKVSTEAIRDTKATGNTEAIREVDSAPLRQRTGPKAIVVGRQAELEQIQGRYADVLAGERRVVFVSGEAGIGKTTFVQAFLVSIARDDKARVGRGQCLEQYGSGEPYMPVLEALSRLGRERDGGQVVEVLGKFAPTWLAQMPGLLTREERVRLQSEIQGVTQQRMLREISEALETLAAESPLVLLIEDLHWSDFSTLELISAIARRSEPARLLIVGTYRPLEMLANNHPLRTMKQELELHHYCEELRLKLLSEEDVEDYLSRRFSGNGLRQFGTLAPVIHARTDGNPLFMVNVVDYLLGKAGVVVRTQEASGVKAPITNGFDTPRNIREMIERNLERLRPEEQVVLESASVAGPEFSAASVAAALERPQSEVEACCTHLSRHEQFVSAQEPVTWPDGTVATSFRFRHALYQEVLYDRLPVGHKIQLHRRIAMREEAGYGERANEVATELAHHYSRASDKNKAIEYLRLAGDRAVARCAFKEAEKAYRQALTMLRLLPESPERNAQELALLIAIASPLSATGGWADPEVESVIIRARELCLQVGESPQLFPVLRGLCAFYVMRGEQQTARELAKQLLGLAERHHDDTLFVPAHYCMGLASSMLGDFVPARTHLEQSIALYNPHRHRSLALLYQFDPRVGSLSLTAWTLWHLGYPEQALNSAKEMLIQARELSHHFSLGLALSWAALLHQLRRDQKVAQECAEAAITLSTERGFSYWSALGTSTRGWALTERGYGEEGIAQLRQGLVAQRTIGAGIFGPFFLAAIAEAQWKMGNTEEGLVVLAEALATVNKTGERHYAAEIHRLKGELLLMKDPSSAAETDRCFRTAIEIAREQSAKSLELRATMSLARLLDKQGRRAEARTLLADIYNWFTEGFDTADLKDTKALLGELA